MTLQQLSAEAAKLPEEDRAALAATLLEGLDSFSYDVSDEEVQRRVKEANEDPSSLLSLEEVLSGLNLRGC